MKKILVMSDSHGNVKNVKRILELCPDADMVIHLGDGASDFTKNLPDNYEKPFVAIEGNGEYYGWVGADRRYRPKRTEIIEFEGKRIFMTHGHLYDVKYGLGRIAARAYADGADIVLFGHTHTPIAQYLPEGTELDFVGKTERPLLLFNPGTAGMGIEHTFGLLTFSTGEVLPSHGKI